MTELTPIRRGRCAGAGNWQTQYQALQMTAREAAELILRQLAGEEVAGMSLALDFQLQKRQST